MFKPNTSTHQKKNIYIYIHNIYYIHIKEIDKVYWSVLIIDIHLYSFKRILYV